MRIDIATVIVSDKKHNLNAMRLDLADHLVHYSEQTAAIRESRNKKGSREGGGAQEDLKDRAIRRNPVSEVHFIGNIYFLVAIDMIRTPLGASDFPPNMCNRGHGRM